MAGVSRTPPSQSPAPPVLKRERSRRGAILPGAKSPMEVNGGGSGQDEKPSNNILSGRGRKVSKVVTAKISEEYCSTTNNNNNNEDEDDMFQDNNCCEDSPATALPTNDPTGRHRQRISLPNMRNNTRNKGHCKNNNNNNTNMVNGRKLTTNCDYIDCCDSTTTNTKRLNRSISLSGTHPRLEVESPVIRRRNVIHCDEIMFFKPQRLSEHQQRVRRKLTHVPNFHENPIEHLEFNEEIGESLTSNREDNFSPAPWMKVASSSLSGHFSPSSLSPTKETMVMVER